MYNAESIKAYENSINHYFKELFPDVYLSINDTKSRVAWTENKLGREFDVDFEKMNNEGEIDKDIPTGIKSIGHGTIRSAIFTLLLLRDVVEEFKRQKGRKDYLVLFEEPELFLYPKIIRELRNLIYLVSEEDLPYQVLCASHSPHMIDLSRPKSSILRLVKDSSGTILHQINDKFLKRAKEIESNEELRQAMLEVLRFNPFICESFYSDEVILVEGPTEEIIARAYIQEKPPSKDIFVLNCGSVTNIPFYQRIFSQFAIQYNVICDTDQASILEKDQNGNPSFNKNIQKTISNQFFLDLKSEHPNKGVLRVHETTFEPAHQSGEVPEELRYEKKSPLGKPYNANLYWKEVLSPNLGHTNIKDVPIIKYLDEICCK